MDNIDFKVTFHKDEIYINAYHGEQEIGCLLLVLHADIYALDSEISETDDYDTAEEVISQLDSYKCVIELANVDVDPQFRKRGVSKRLLEYVLNEYGDNQFYLRVCPTGGADEKTLVASLNKYGFIEIDNNDNGTFMVKRCL